MSRAALSKTFTWDIQRACGNRRNISLGDCAPKVRTYDHWLAHLLASVLTDVHK